MIFTLKKYAAVVSVFGTLLPSFTILSLISMAYSVFKDNEAVSTVLNGMQAGVAAIIVNVVISMSEKIGKEKDFISAVIMIGAFTAAYFFKVNIILIILICGVFGIVRDYIARKIKKRNSKIKKIE